MARRTVTPVLPPHSPVVHLQSREARRQSTTYGRLRSWLALERIARALERIADAQEGYVLDRRRQARPGARSATRGGRR